MKNKLILTVILAFQFYVAYPQINSGSLAPVVSFSSGVTTSNPAGIACGDLDGDGKKDMVVTNNANVSISVFRNASSMGSITTGTFTSKFDQALAVAPNFPYLADFDGDGKKDIAVSGNTGSTISIFRNTSTLGNITLATRQDITGSTIPSAFVLEDFDGDGKTDLVSSNYASTGSYSIFRNTSTTGSISFATRSDVSIGASTFPSYICATDIDGDGKKDIAITFAVGSGQAAFFRNTSTLGAISFATAVSVSTGSVPNFISTGDVDGDGKSDFVTGNFSSHTFSIIRNTSTSGVLSFASAVNIVSGSGTPNPQGSLIADLDNDGRPEITVVNRSNNNIAVFKNMCTPGNIAANTFASAVTFSGLTTPMTIAGEDIDLDGNTDLLICNNGGNSVGVFRNQSPFTTYYNKSVGDLNQLSTWGRNADGSGSSPNSFDSANVIYIARNNASPAISGNWNISGSNSRLVLGDGLVSYNLIIPNSTTLSVDSLILKNNISITCQGIISCNKMNGEEGSNVQFIGSGAQVVGAGNYHNLVLIAAAKTLGGNVSVSGTLSMAQNINCNGYLLTIGSSASKTGNISRSGGTVIGSLRRWFANSTNSGSGSGLFPIGTSTQYLPVQVEYTTAPTTGGTLTALFNTTNPGLSGLPLFDAGVLTDKTGVNGFWSLQANSLAGGAYTLSITATGFYGINTISDLRILRRNIGTLSWSVNGTHSAVTGTVSAPTVVRTGLTLSGGEFSLAGEATVNPLPVVWGSLNATVIHSSMSQIQWTTFSEINNDRYIVEKSSDLTAFYTIAEVAAGKEYTGNKYAVHDNNYSGNRDVYYRIKQIDKNGSYTYSEVLMIPGVVFSKTPLSIYPNPFSSSITVTGSQNIPYTITDISGKVLASFTRDGVYDLGFLNSGVYFLLSESGAIKLIKQ